MQDKRGKADIARQVFLVVLVGGFLICLGLALLKGWG